VSHYRPVSCALHSTLELAIMQRRRLRVSDAQGRSLEGMGVDLMTRAEGEFLALALASGERVELRLDELREVLDAVSGEHLGE